MARTLRFNQARRKNRRTRANTRHRHPQVETLEPRIVLAPMIADGEATDTDLTDVFAIRPVTDQVTGRIEIAPVSFAGGDTFVVERLGQDPDNDGVIERPDAADAGTISRITPSGNVSIFATVPGGGNLGFGGYKNFFDIVIDPIGIFDGVPSLFVSASDQVDAAKNAIYRFDVNGNLLDGAPFATFTEDSNSDLTFDDHPTVMALNPGNGEWPAGLYVADVEEESFSEGDDLFVFQPGYMPGSIINSNTMPSGVTRIADMARNVSPPDGPLPDMDARAMVFDPGNQYESTLIMASTDLEDGTESTTMKFDPPLAGSGEAFDSTLFQPLTTHLWMDASFDNGGFLSTDMDGEYIGSYFVTDSAGGGDEDLRGVIHRIHPEGQFNNGGEEDPFAFNFRVTDPAMDIIPDVTLDDETAGMNGVFSISISPDGQRIQIADLDGIWEIRTDVGLPCSMSGDNTGVCDVLVDLGRPYRGAGLAVAVIDTGVDSAHSGFGGLVTEGRDVALGTLYNKELPGTLDEMSHGTNGAGVIHQIAPEAVIVPVKTDVSGTGGLSNRQILWEGVRYVADNPIVEHPITGELVPVVAGNMSFGLINSEQVYDSEREAAQTDGSSLYTFKDQMQRWRSLGIYPVASAGNEGTLFEEAMDGMDLPAVINEVVSVGATYPYGPTPPLEPPAGTELVDGDLIAFPDKVAAFSSRSQDTDFMAPGTAVRTFNSTIDLDFDDFPDLPPINLNYTGTSASAPYVTGIFTMVYSAVDFWSDVASDGSTTEGFLGASDAVPVNMSSILDIGPYLTPDGVHAILQWTSVPVNDIDLVFEDEVAQQFRLRNNGEDSTEYRTYSRIDAGQAISAIEGAIAFDYFSHHPGLVAEMDSDNSGILTATEIQNFSNDSSNSPTSRAMASMIGGTSSDSIQKRTDLFDRLNGDNGLGVEDGIGVHQIDVLADSLLPSLGKFRITQRTANGNEGYLTDSDATRNWHDLVVLGNDINFVDGVPDIYRGAGPKDGGGAVATSFKVMMPRDPYGDDNGTPSSGGGSSPPDSGGTPEPTPGEGTPSPGDGSQNPGTGGGDNSSDPSPGTGQPGGDNSDSDLKPSVATLYRGGKWFFDVEKDGGVGESISYFGISGDRAVPGDWDGDGFDEMAIYRNGQWFFDMDGKGGVSEKSFWFGLPGDIPVAGDFNGDGTSDAAVYRNGQWFVDLDGQGGIGEKSFWFGLQGDVPVVADWDGNGSADATVYRQGQWFADLGGDGGTDEKSFWFGLQDDIPLAGDWDNNGIVDPAIFRNGQWFLDLAGDGGIAEESYWYGLPDDNPVAYRFDDQTETSSVSVSGLTSGDNSDLSGPSFGSGAFSPTSPGIDTGDLDQIFSSEWSSSSPVTVPELIPVPAASPEESDEVVDNDDTTADLEENPVEQALAKLLEEWTDANLIALLLAISEHNENLS